MVGEQRYTLSRLAAVLKEVLSCSFSARTLLGSVERERVDSAADFLDSFTQNGEPDDPQAARRMEVSWIEALGILKKADLPKDVADRVVGVMRLYQKDMIQRKRMASSPGSWKIEDEINAPGDDSVN